MINQKKNSELIKFEDGDFTLDVNVWLSKKQIAELYDRDRSVISKHIKNIFAELECDYSNVQKMHIPNSDKPIISYDLMNRITQLSRNARLLCYTVKDIRLNIIRIK